MASAWNYFFILIAFIMASMTKAWPLLDTPAPDPEPEPIGLGLAARLRLEGTDDEPSMCWKSLFELQACSGEVIMFFINGETYLGPGCCQAIRVIGNDCWPNIIGTLGFTSEEGDILQVYCDSIESVDHEPKKNMLP